MASQDPALLRRLLRAKDRMDAASEEDWPVERLADVSGVSAAHFARSFNEAFGVPPNRYLLTRRIERAKALRVGLLGEIAVAANHKRLGMARRLVRSAHDHLRARSIPFSILFAFEPRVYASSGYKLMQNEARFLDADGHWKILVYRGGMVAELSARRWPNQPIDLCGTAV